MRRPVDVYVVRLRNTHYAYSGGTGDGSKWTVHQRLARRFESAASAWEYALKPYGARYAKAYRVVRLRPRCCRCSR